VYDAIALGANNPRSIRDATGYNYHSIRSALIRLTNRGAIERVSRGVYDLAPEEEEVPAVWRHVYTESRWSQGDLVTKEFVMFTEENVDVQSELEDQAEQAFSERGSSDEIEASAFSSEEIPELPEIFGFDEIYEEPEGVQEIDTL